MERFWEVQEVGQMVPTVQYFWIVTEHIFNAAKSAC